MRKDFGSIGKTVGLELWKVGREADAIHLALELLLWEHGDEIAKKDPNIVRRCLKALGLGPLLKRNNGAWVGEMPVKELIIDYCWMNKEIPGPRDCVQTQISTLIRLAGRRAGAEPKLETFMERRKESAG